MMKNLKLRNRQRKPRLILCPGVYGVGEASRKIINFAESQYCRPDTTTVVCSLAKESKVVMKNIGPPESSHQFQESQF